MKTWLIYKHTCKINNKSYIGLTCKNISIRWNEHVSDTNTGRSNSYFHNAIRKYGKEMFTHEILHDNISCVKEADRLECMYIKMYNTSNKKIGYNLTEGGSNGKITSLETRIKLSEKSKGRLHSDETKALMSKSRKGENNSMYGKNHTDKAKKKMSESRKGENNVMYGKNHTEETRLKIAISATGRKHSKETIEKMSESRKGKKLGRNNPSFIGYFKTPFSDELFESTTACIEFLKNEHNISISKYTVLDRCRNEREKWKEWKLVMNDG